jgi:two-component system, NarL family, invasion response regulator UvrY
MPQNQGDRRKDVPIRVFVADDHPLVLAGLKSLIASEAQFELVGDARNGAEALSRAISLRPDVLLLDLCMPGLSGLDVARGFLAASPNSRVVVLTVLEDQFFLRRVFEAGISGYVLKRSATEQLGRAIRAVVAGTVYLDTAFDLTVVLSDVELRTAARRVGLDTFAESIAANCRRPT